jgi:CubicO group peptidase (beta-lactamase class C family)
MRTLFAAVAMLTSIFGVPGWSLAQAPLPASGVVPSLDSLGRAVVAAINGNEAHRAGFLDQRVSLALPTAGRQEISELLRDLHSESDGLDIVRLEPVGSGLFLTVKARRYPKLALLNVVPDRSDPKKARVVELLKSWNPKSDSLHWPREKLATEQAVASVIRTNVETLSSIGAFSGVVLVGKGNRVLFEQGYGWANLEDSVRNTPSTRITIASIGKMFTATAIGQLMSSGKLKLDDTLARILPEYPNTDRARRITIRQLLQHTAGLGDLFSDSAYDAHRDYTSALLLASAVADRPLQFEPGTRWSYSNEGYIVLGAVIEKVSGERYDEYLKRHVFGPAGMSHTGNFGADEVIPHRAVGYRHRTNDPLGVRPPYGNRTFVGKGSPAGGAYTTAGDLWRFSRALLEGRLVDAKMRDTLWTGRSKLPWDKEQLYGYGVIVSTVGGRATLGHGGGGSGTGIDNEFRFFRDGSYTVIVLANIDPPAASNLGQSLLEFLARQ